jgi:hypothetical protein
MGAADVAAGTNGQLSFTVTVATNVVYTLNATANYQVGVTPFSATSPNVSLAHQGSLTGTLLSPGHFQVGVNGDLDGNYQLQSSGDLVHWQPLTNTTGGAAIPVSLVSTQQFFRLLGQ